jgi:hypothetical protein
MTLIRPAVTYARETWTLSVRNINNLLVFERQILRKIFGQIQCKEGWRIRSNKELQKLITGEHIVKNTKAQRINVGDILPDRKLVKKISDWNSVGIGTKGQPKNRLSNKLFNEAKIGKLDPVHKRQKSLE